MRKNNFDTQGISNFFKRRKDNSKKQIRLIKKHGVSLVSLVITIIVVIILAAIAVYSSISTVASADYAAFAHEYAEIEQKVQVVRKENVLNGESEEARNKGFPKVTVSNPPSSFVSASYGEITGYLVSLDYVNISGAETGKGVVVGEHVTFNKDDVYIYDGEGKVYYAGGFSDGEGKIRYRLDEVEENNKPIISLVEYTLNEDQSKALVKVIAEPAYGGALTVTVGGKVANKTGNNIYEVEIDKNGNILISAKEDGRGTAYETLTISGLMKAVYTITYDANGGSGAPASQTKEEGSNITLREEIPTRANYTFIGWGTSASSTTATYQPRQDYSANSSITLYAIWEAEKYTVAYDANGGSEAPGPQVKVHGQPLTLSTALPSRSGYEFLGWGTAASSVSANYQPGNTYSTDSNLTLYAIWKTITYTVTYDANGGSGAPIAQTKTHGQTLTLSNEIPTRTGYTFEGWGTSASSTTVAYNAGGSYTSDSEATLYAIWKTKTYTVTYDANGGSDAPASQTKTHGQTLTLSSTTPKRTGYIFQGWGTSATSTTVVWNAGGSFTTDSDTTLYAIWKAKTYTVTFYANGGSGAPTAQTKTHGQALTLSNDVPTRTGYTFQGWSATESSTTAEYNAGGSFTTDSDTILYAVWKAITYTVTYDANGGSGAPTAQTKTHGQTLVLSSTVPTRTGYTFQGWSINASSTTAEYSARGNFTTESDTTLYAIWKVITYTVTYNANGGSGAPSAQTKTHNKSLTLSNIIPTRTGYTFEGWSVNSSATSADYQAEAPYTGNSDLTLYAVWKATTCTIIYNANNGNLGNVPTSETATSGTTYTITSEEPTRDGYTFLGWNTSSTATTATYVAGTPLTVSANLTLYAVWSYNGNVCCFVEGTEIMVSLDGTTKAIEDFKAGDTVVSYNVETGENYIAEVQGLIINPIPVNMARVYLKDGSMVDMTDYHPLYTKDGFHSITNKDGYDTLVVGDIVKTANSWSEIVEIELYKTEPMNVYNIAVKDYDEVIDDDTNDCYYANEILAHNVGCDIPITPVDSYTITYNANNGELGSVPTSETATAGTTYTITSEEPTRAGYTFLGWSTSSTATTATYVGGAQLTWSTDITLYAVWSANSSCCFVEGTQIMVSLDGTSKAIEDFKPGDTVVSYNVETGEDYIAEVQELIINPIPVNMARVYLKDGSMVDMTDYHPLYTKDGFHSITNKNGYDTLVVGDVVKTTTGWSEIVEIELYETEPMNVYNLAIKDYDEIIDDDTNDCYYANGILAHNAGSECGHV